MSIVVVNTDQSSSTLSGLTDKHIQQAAVDISIERVWSMSGEFVIDEEKKVNRASQELHVGDDGYFHLAEGVYEVSFPHEVRMGPDEAAIIITRSSLVRQGVHLVSGVWDPSFKGKGGCCMHVRGGPMKIKPGTRVGQFVIWKVLNAQGAYDGQYGLTETGDKKESERKYYETTVS